MSHQNGLWSWTNLVDLAATNINASSEVAELPATNLQDSRVKRVWRSDGVTVATLDFDFGGQHPAAVVAILNVNMRANVADQIRIQLSPTLIGDPGTHDSGWFDPKVDPDYRQVVYPIPGAIETPMLVQQLRIEFNAPSSLPAIEAGRVHCGPWDWLPKHNFTYGSRSTAINSSVRRRLPKSNGVLIDKQPIVRMYALEYDGITEQERKNEIRILTEVVSFMSQVLFVPYIADDADLPHEPVFGRVEDMGETTWLQWELNGKTLSIMEDG